MIVLNSLFLKIQNKNILSDITVSFEKGSFISVVGPSGAGKSSLARLICGLVEPSNGQISLENRPLKDYSVKSIAKKISYVSQESDSSSDFTVWDLMELSKYPFWDSSKKLTMDEEIIAESYLEKLDILTLKKRSLNSLSGGERQRAYIASALFQGSEYVILDEPTSALDPGHQHDIMKILREEQKIGKTIIMVSHDINMALHICDQVIALKEGKLFFSGSPVDFSHSDKLDQLFNLTFKKYTNVLSRIPFLVGWEDI